MLGSGTEAVMAAIRVARLATRKKNVIKIGGAYHGWSDRLVYSLKIPHTRRFEAHGIPRAATRHTREAAPNDLGSLERALAPAGFPAAPRASWSSPWVRRAARVPWISITTRACGACATSTARCSFSMKL